ncbi:MAG: hypothetical protein ACYDCC_06115 [Actinomycetota bacterium]
MRSEMKRTLIVLLLAFAACSKSPPMNASVIPSLKGSLVVANQTGTLKDAMNAMGQKPVHPLASAEILGVRIDADGRTMIVHVQLGGSPLTNLPDQDKEGPDWFMHVWRDTVAKGAPAYIIAITRTGKPRLSSNKQILGWSLSICPGNGPCSNAPTGATLQMVGSQILFKVPLDALKGLANKISWAMQSFWTDVPDPRLAWSDWVPQAARPAPGATTYPAPEKRAQFPSSK